MKSHNNLDHITKIHSLKGLSTTIQQNNPFQDNPNIIGNTNAAHIINCDNTNNEHMLHTLSHKKACYFFPNIYIEAVKYLKIGGVLL